MSAPAAFATLAKLHQQMADVYAELATEAESCVLALGAGRADA